MDSFSKRLRTLRMEKGMKQSELAEALHFSQGMASAYENGREPPFDVDYLLGLTSARKQDNGALIEETNHAAQQTESVGAPPIDSADIRALMTAITAYADAHCPAGTAPLVVSHDLILRLTDMLSALGSENVANILDANNALLSSLLDVSNITTTYLSNNK